MLIEKNIKTKVYDINIFDSTLNLKINLFLMTGETQVINLKLNRIKQNEEQTIKKLKEYIRYIKRIPGVNDLIQSYENNSFIFYPEKSNIIKKLDDFQFIYKELCKKLNKEKITLYQKFNVLKDGDSATKFHEKCDNIGPNLTIIKTKKNIIMGGFTTRNWEYEEKSKKDDLAFIFNFNNKKIFNIKKGENAITSRRNQLINFWNGKDSTSSSLVVVDKCFNNSSCSNNTCKKNETSYEDIENDYEINNGDFQFYVSEMEVYEIN